VQPAARYWADFVFLLAYIVIFNSALYAIDGWMAVFLGFVVPYITWNYLIGFTVLVQHTHPSVPWLSDEQQWSRLRGQEELAIRIKYLRWYGLISLDIMEHPAQKRLDELLGERSITFNFTPWLLFDIFSKCQLYDYANHTWLDFAGQPTTGITLTDQSLLTP
jgi:omega-6 fatty acid desaturase (delta-12 desaturase)